MSRKTRTFYYFIVDGDQKLFNLLGPISSDRDYNVRVVESQDTGRKLTAVSCDTVEEADAAKRYYEAGGFQQTSRLLTASPIDRSAEYGGDLPSYAKSADRNRVVKFLCPRCRSMRFA